MADMQDGMFVGIKPMMINSPGDAGTQMTSGSMGHQSPNEYTSMVPDADDDDY